VRDLPVIGSTAGAGDLPGGQFLGIAHDASCERRRHRSMSNCDNDESDCNGDPY